MANGLAWGFTDLASGRDAARDLRRQLDQPALELVVVFCSPEYRDSDFNAAITEAFDGVQVIGCTTSGELTPNGYCSNGISAFSFAAPDFFAETAWLPAVDEIDMAAFNNLAGQCLGALNAKIKRHEGDLAVQIQSAYRSVGFVLMDGLWKREETLISSLTGSVGTVPLFGASAGDNLRFEETSVLVDGTFRDKGGVLALLSTCRPFKVFQHQHFIGSDIKMVVTDADPEQRIVREINAEVAVEEYARLAGLDVDNLTPMDFATHPLLVRLGGAEFVRSIQQANPDGSLSFYCAVDEGLVLTLAESGDLVGNLEQLFTDIEEEIGEPEAVLAFDCVLRRLELEHTQQLQRIPPLFSEHRVTGFSTFGEQYASTHVNQTFTGLAIGKRDSGQGRSS